MLALDNKIDVKGQNSKKKQLKIGGNSQAALKPLRSHTISSGVVKDLINLLNIVGTTINLI